MFLLTFTENLMTYALGRRLEASDMPTVRAIVRDAAQKDNAMSAFLAGIVESPAFRRVRVSSPGRADRRRLAPARDESLRAQRPKDSRTQRPQDPGTPSRCSSPRQHLSRRTVLKGLGATIALPVLDAMTPAGASAAQSRRRPCASIALEMVHGSAGSTTFGIKKNMWAPAAAGTAFDLSPTSLRSLEPYRDYLTIVSNTDVRNAEAFAAVGDRRRSLPHRGGVPDAGKPKQTQGSDVFAGTSFDQICAKAFGEQTPIPSMQLCIENVDQAGGCSYNYSCVYTDTISWASPTEPLPMIRDPRAVFDQLFGVGTTPEARKARRRDDRSILDFVTESVGDLKRQLGAADRARLTDYLDDVREIERRIQKVEASNASGEPRELPDAPVGVPDSFEEHVKLMFDLQAVAFAVGHDANLLVQAARDVSNRVYGPSGSTTAFHTASHHLDRDERITDFQKINTYHVSMVPYLLDKLKATPDGGRQRARQHAGHLRIGDGQLEPAQPQALPAVPRRARRRRAEGPPPHPRGRRHADGQRHAVGAARARRRDRHVRRQHGGDGSECRRRTRPTRRQK